MNEFTPSVENNDKVMIGRTALIKKKRKLYKEDQCFLHWGTRKVIINPLSKQDTLKFPDNTISFCRYKWYTFLPRFFLQQFTTLPKLSFIVIYVVRVILQTPIPPNSFYLSLLLCHFAIELAKDAWQDIQRYRYSCKWNDRRVTLVSDTEPFILRVTKVKKLCVGNIVYLTNGEEVPADIVLLCSSKPDGVAYLDTTGINGRTDLTLKVAVKETRGALTASTVGAIRGRIMCEQPVASLDSFNGNLKLDAHPRSTPLDAQNFIIGGSVLQNTEFIFGVVVYTGEDSKIVRINRTFRRKQFTKNSLLNRYIILLFILIFLFTVVSMALHYEFNKNEKGLRAVSESLSVANFFTWEFIIKYFGFYTNLIPISLMISLDILGILRYILLDTKTTKPAQNLPYSSPQILRCCDDKRALMLGSVDFFFTDKTETLTERKLQFQACCVGDRVYGVNSHTLQPVHSHLTRRRSGCSQKSYMSRFSSCHPRVSTTSNGSHVYPYQHGFSSKPCIFGANSRGANIPRRLCSPNLHHCQELSSPDVYSSQRARQTNTKSQKRKVSICLDNHYRSSSTFSEMPPDRDKAFLPEAIDLVPQHNDSIVSLSSHQQDYHTTPVKQNGTSTFVLPRLQKLTLLASDLGQLEDSPDLDKGSLLASNATMSGALAYTLPCVNFESLFSFTSLNILQLNASSDVKALSVFPGVELNEKGRDSEFRGDSSPQPRGEKGHTSSDSNAGFTSLLTAPTEEYKTTNSRRPSISVNGHFACDEHGNRAPIRDFHTAQSRGFCDFYDERLLQDLDEGGWRSEKIDHFIKAMALCNTVIPYVTSNNHPDVIRASLNSSSTIRKSGLHTHSNAGSMANSETVHSGVQDPNYSTRRSQNRINSTRRSQNRIYSTRRSQNRTYSTRQSQDVADYSDVTKGSSVMRKRISTYPHGSRVLHTPHRFNRAVSTGSLCSVFITGVPNENRTTMIHCRRYTNRVRRSVVEEPKQEKCRKQESRTFKEESGNSHKLNDSRTVSTENSHVSKVPKPSYETKKGGRFLLKPWRRLKELSSILKRKKHNLSQGSSRDAWKRGNHQSFCRELIKKLAFNNSSSLNSTSGERSDKKSFPWRTLKRTPTHLYLNAHESLHRVGPRFLRESNFFESIFYQAYSADEECLAYTASYLGYTLLSKTKSFVYLAVGDSVEQFELYGGNMWTPLRKRVSVVLKSEGDDGAIVYCKGAEETVLPLLAESEDSINHIKRQIDTFSRDGLRCLVFAYKYLSVREAQRVRQDFKDLSHLKTHPNDDFLHETGGFEKNLKFLGVSAARTKLKDDVSQVIEKFSEAGMRIWMVTGDNRDHSVRVGFSSRIIPHHAHVFYGDLKLADEDHNTDHIIRKEAYDLFEQFRLMRLSSQSCHAMCFVVSGQSLSTYFRYPELLSLFLLMTCSCDSVICCRVTPDQKGQLVRIIQTKLKPSPVVLAIGDSRGDISMLHAADCAVAMKSSNCSPIVAACDYYIPNFSTLNRLVFVNSRLHSVQTCILFLLVLFQSLLLVFPLFFYGCFCGFSATIFYNITSYIGFHYLFVSALIVILSALYQDIPDHICENVPLLYALTRRNFYFNVWIFIFWFCETAILGIVCFFILLTCLSYTPISCANASSIDVSSMGFIMLHVTGLCIYFKLLLYAKTSWGRRFTFIIIIAILHCFYSYIYCTTEFGILALGGVPQQWLFSPALLLSIFLILFLCLIVHVGFCRLHELLFDDIVCDILKSAREWNFIKKNNYDTDLNLVPLHMMHQLRECHTVEDYLRKRYNPLLDKDLLYRLPAPSHFKLIDFVMSYSFLFQNACDRKYDPNGYTMTARLSTNQDYDSVTLSTGWRSSSDDDAKRSFNEGDPYAIKAHQDNEPYDICSLSSSNYGTQPTWTNDAQTSRNEFLGLRGKKNKHSWSPATLNSSTKEIKLFHLAKRFLLHFKDSQLEAEFQNARHKENIRSKVWYRFVLVSLLIAYLFQLGMVLCSIFISSVVYSWISIIFMEMCILLCLLLSFTNWFYYYLHEIFIILLILNIVRVCVASIDSQLSICYTCIFGTLSFVILRLPFVSSFLLNAFFLVMLSLEYLVINPSHTIFFLTIPHALGITIFIGFAGYRLEYNQRKQFLLNYQVEASRRKQREILNTMLPSFVVEKMLNSRLTVDGIPVELKAENYTNITVLFCDVYDFQNIVRSLEPIRLVEVLDSLFLCFDKCAEQFGCTKIETVFETYLSASGLRNNLNVKNEEEVMKMYKNNAFDALDMAVAMLEIAPYIQYEVDVLKMPCSSVSGAPNEKTMTPYTPHRVMDENASHEALSLQKHTSQRHTCTKGIVDSKINHEQSYAPSHVFNNSASMVTSYENSLSSTLLQREARRVHLKIGIHSGRVISGVVGAKKPQYALFGDTVNTASRMKLLGEPDMIHVSDATYHLLYSDKKLKWASRALDVKGKGIMTTYLLTEVFESKYPSFEVKRDLFLDSEWNSALQNCSLESFSDESGMAPDNLRSPEKHYSERLQYRRVSEHSRCEPLDRTESNSNGDEPHNNPTQRTVVDEDRSPVFWSTPLLRMDKDAAHSSDYSSTTQGNNNNKNRKPNDLYFKSNTRNGSSDDNCTYSPMSTRSPSFFDDRYCMDRLVRKRSGSLSMLYKQNRIADQKLQLEKTKRRRLSIVQHILSRKRTQECTGFFFPRRKSKQLKESKTTEHPTSTRRRSHHHSSFREEQLHSSAVMLNDSNTVSSSVVPMSFRQKVETFLWPFSKPSVPKEAVHAPSSSQKDIMNSVLNHQTTDVSKSDMYYNQSIGMANSVPDTDDGEGSNVSVFHARKLHLHSLTLAFCSRTQEDNYKNFFYSNISNFRSIEQSLMTFLIMFVSHTMMEILFNGTRRTETTEQSFALRSVINFWTVRAVYTLSWFITWIIFHYRCRVSHKAHENIRWMILVLNATFVSATFIFMISGAWAYEYVSFTCTFLLEKGVRLLNCVVETLCLMLFISFKRTHLEWLETDSIQLVFFITFMHHNTGVLFQHVILMDSLFLVMVVVYVHVVCAPTPETLFIIFFICPILFFNGLSAHLKERIDRATWFVSEERKTTEDKARELLRDMLPKHALEEFQQDKLKLAYRHDQMTFLFADICGFTAYANSVDAAVVLQTLQYLFACFDHDSTRFGLFKLCTIGDAYIAVSQPMTEHCPDVDSLDGAERVLEMAHNMIVKIREVRQHLNIPQLNMRIGLHYGSCVGGVIGSGRLRYDLWGLDVLTGNIMESNGVPGHINVSDSLKTFLEQQFPGRFQFRWNKTVVVIDRVVNSFLLLNPLDEKEEMKRDGMSDISSSSTPAARDRKRRFSVLGLYFPSNEDAKRTQTKKHAMRNAYVPK